MDDFLFAMWILATILLLIFGLHQRSKKYYYIRMLIHTENYAKELHDIIDESIKKPNDSEADDV